VREEMSPGCLKGGVEVVVASTFYSKVRPCFRVLPDKIFDIVEEGNYPPREFSLKEMLDLIVTNSSIAMQNTKDQTTS
jgi:hypothetical protein